MSVLLTGGAGFIGSHTAVAMIEAGYDVIIADDLSNSSLKVIDRIEAITGTRPAFYRIDVADRAALEPVFQSNRIEGVIHFAGFKSVPESTRIPLKYYRNNLDTALTVLEVMEDYDCSAFVFSSSATVYGETNEAPFVETMPTGSPRAEESTSYCTKSRAMAMSPTASRSVRQPATPTLITSSGLYRRIIVWAHIAALTLPTPPCTSTTSRPHSLPLWKRMPLTSRTAVTMVFASSSSISTGMAPMIPIMLPPPITSLENARTYSQRGHDSDSFNNFISPAAMWRQGVLH